MTWIIQWYVGWFSFVRAAGYQTNEWSRLIVRYCSIAYFEMLMCRFVVVECDPSMNLMTCANFIGTNVRQIKMNKFILASLQVGGDKSIDPRSTFAVKVVCQVSYNTPNACYLNTPKGPSSQMYSWITMLKPSAVCLEQCNHSSPVEVFISVFPCNWTWPTNEVNVNKVWRD